MNKRIFILIVGMVFSSVSINVFGQTDGGDEPCTDTNCAASAITTNCTEGSVLLTPNPVIICGLPITVSVTETDILGQVILDTSYTNACGFGCSDTFTTNNLGPSIISRSWVDSEGGSGSGLKDTIFPTTPSGTVTFTVNWQHTACDTNADSTSAAVNYSVPCPTISSCTVLSSGDPTGGSTGARIGYNFDCVGGWYSWESITESTDNCGTPGPTSSLTNATLGVDWSGADVGGGDKIYDPNPPGATCIHVTQQTIYFALVDGGGTKNDNSVCSFPNTQTIIVIQTNSSSPAHGIVTVSVTIGGGTNATYTY